MRTENRYHRALVCSLIALLLVTFVVCSSPSLYARPSRDDSPSDRSDSGSKHSSDNQTYRNESSPRSDSGGYSKSESNHESKHEQRSEDRSYTPPPPPPAPEPRNDNQESYYPKHESNNDQVYRSNRSEDESRNAQRDEPKHGQAQYESQQHSNNNNNDVYSSKERDNNSKHGNEQYGSQQSDSNTNDAYYLKQRDDRSKHGNTQYGPSHSSENTNDAYSSKERDNNAKHGNGQYGSQQQGGTSNGAWSSKARDNNLKHDRIVTPDNGHSSTQFPGISPKTGDPNMQSKHALDIAKRTVVTNTGGTYRKDYADFSKFWKHQREQRSIYQNNYGGHGTHSDVHININFFPGASYSYYAYDYDPWTCYPSVYGYYYGLFPPYIHHRRVIIYHYPVVVYRYIELPLAIIYRDYPRDSYYYQDDYYLSSYGYRGVGTALRDIERAWERNDPNLLFDHVDRGEKIDVFLHGDYAYTLDSQDYRDMTVDAMAHIRTTSFEFYKVRQRRTGEVVAYGKHTYYDYDAYGATEDFFSHSHYDTKTTYISYTLERYDGEWYITEVGSSPDRF